MDRNGTMGKGKMLNTVLTPDGNHFVNINTGEILGPAGTYRKMYKSDEFSGIYNKGWSVMSSAPYIALAKDKDLTLTSINILHYMLGTIGYGNIVTVTQKDIVEALGIAQGHVSKSIKLLVEKEILLKYKKVGNGWTYRLNPTYGYRGSASLKGEGEKIRRIEDGKVIFIDSKIST